VELSFHSPLHHHVMVLHRDIFNLFYYVLFSFIVPTKCSSRGWIFDGVPNYELVGFDIVTYISDTREECMLQCLHEKRFICRSAEFTYAAKRCVLSNQDRRTRSDSYRATPWGVEYFENQCVDPRKWSA
jgi:hypothetical protein